eukprot:1902614-Pleurochrysis_carterae.AAC.1
MIAHVVMTAYSTLQAYKGLEAQLEAKTDSIKDVSTKLFLKTRENQQQVGCWLILIILLDTSKFVLEKRFPIIVHEASRWYA